MKLGVLCFRSRNSDPAVEELRLLEAAEHLGHEAVLLPAWECAISYGSESVFWKGEPLPHFDALLPRARFIYHSELQLHLLSILENSYPVLNRAARIMRAKNKIRTMQTLLQAGLPMPKSTVIDGSSQLEQVVHSLHAYPVILKAPYGTFGYGVYCIRSFEEGEKVFSDLMARNLSSQMIVQDFIEEADGKDMRLFVLRDKVIAAMERQAAPGEFRSNIELGATAYPVQASPELCDLACRAVEALGLDYGGVDIVQSKTGPLILEVNANPGFKKLEEISGVDVAQALVKAAFNGGQPQ